MILFTKSALGIRDVSDREVLIRSTFAAAVGVATVAAAYFPSLGAFFIKDDLALLSAAHPEFPEVFARPWLGGFYRPVSELIIGLQYGAFGLTAWPYHLVSLTIHLAAAGFVYGIAARLLADRTQAFGAALLFAVHPLHTESVTWISGQMSLLAGLLGLGFLYALISTRFAPAAVIPLAAVAFAGIGTYESFLVVPAVWMVLWLGTRRDLIALVAPLVLFAVLVVLRGKVVGLGTGPYEFSPSLTVGIVNLAYYMYLLLGGTAAGGRILNYAIQDAFSAGSFLFLLPPLLLLSVSLLIAAVAGIRRRASLGARSWLFGLAGTTAALLPALFMDTRPRRISYLAVAGYAMLAAALAQRSGMRMGRMTLPAVTALIVACAVTTFSRNWDWAGVGELEEEILELMASEVVARDCGQVVVDVPNLVGDALFFHSNSAESWLRLRRSNIPVRHAYEPASRIDAKKRTAFISVVNSASLQSDSSAVRLPKYDRGRNWLRDVQGTSVRLETQAATLSGSIRRCL